MGIVLPASSVTVSLEKKKKKKTSLATLSLILRRDRSAVECGTAFTVFSRYVLAKYLLETGSRPVDGVAFWYTDIHQHPQMNSIQLIR